jgi:hypothetical protein
VMMSLMPLTPARSTSSATRNASVMGMFWSMAAAAAAAPPAAAGTLHTSAFSELQQQHLTGIQGRVHGQKY